MELYKVYLKVYNEVTLYEVSEFDWNDLDISLKEKWEEQVFCIDKLYKKLSKSIINQEELFGTMFGMLINTMQERIDNNIGVGMVTRIDLWRMVYKEFFDLVYRKPPDNSVILNMYS